MQAIVAISATSQGTSTQLLGYGNAERDARQAAFTYLNGGHNDFGQEYQGGVLVTVSADLAGLISRASMWEDTLGEEGTLIGSVVPVAHTELMFALGMLFVENGQLFSRK